MEMIDKNMKSTKTSEAHPRVSIITVTYNAESLLERTLQSVLVQRYADKEIVVVDGQSSDGTVAVIKRHAAAIQSWVSEPDKGIYDAMNKGVRMATGDWILFMNAGDTFASDDVLQRLFDAVDPAQADVVYGDVVKGGVVKAAPRQYRLYHRMLFCHQSVLTRRSCLLDTPLISAIAFPPISSFSSFSISVVPASSMSLSPCPCLIRAASPTVPVPKACSTISGWSAR